MCICGKRMQLEIWKHCSKFNVNEKGFKMKQNSSGVKIGN